MITVKYEEAIKRLREICDKLSDESTTLEETAALYKEGTKLAEDCRKMLEQFGAELEKGAADES